MAKKNKFVTSGIAVATAAALMFGGTFAWQSISQQALNEVSASVNPGGRLHDDFNNISDTENAVKVELNGREITAMTFDKDVYVENFTEYAENGVQVFARVRLDEYMELGQGAGQLNETEDGPAATNHALPLVDGTKLQDKNSWQTYKFGEDSAFRTYWALNFGGSTVYMPTFNKNKDSLEADINGSSADDFASYADYELGDVNGVKDNKVYAIYDVDAEEDENTKEVDELAEAGIKAETVIQRGHNALLDPDGWVKHIELVQEQHETRETLDGAVISMAAYLQGLQDGYLALDEETIIGDFDGTGNFWVYDEDGWAYWANPIDPESATGLLLDQFNRTGEIINQDWYYAINVVAQFVTCDDLGQDDGTGFYDSTAGEAPSANALNLLKNIGVQVGTDVNTAEALEAALTEGGVVSLTADVTIDDQITITNDTVLNLNGYTLTGNDVQDWDNDKVWSLLSVQGEDVTLTINKGTFQATVSDELSMKDSYCVDVRDGAKLIINGGKFVGNVSAVYVYAGQAVINGGEFSIDKQNSTEPENKYILNCYDANWLNGTAKITVCGGTFHNFDPAQATEDTAVNGGKYLAEGYTSTDNGEGVFTVTKTAAPTVEEGEDITTDEDVLSL